MMLLLMKLLQVYSYCILIRVILSWIQPGMNNQFSYILYRITEPVLEPIRRIVPPLGGSLDVSPIIAILIIQAIARML